MVNYARLSGKRKQFLALTGLTLEEFLALLPAFQKCFQKYVEIYTLEGKKRQKRRYVDYANSPLRTIEDKLLFILIYLRKATTQDIFGEVFKMPQPVANKWIHILHACLNQALAALGEKPARRVEDLHLAEEKGQLSSRMARNGPSRGPKTQKFKRNITVGRKNTIASRTMCWPID